MFGPVPRTYEHKLTKKMRRAALASALTQWLSEGAITVVDEISVDEFKTKRVIEILQGLGLANTKVLIVTDDVSPILEASARNIPGVGLVRAEGLNVYDILRHPKVLMTRAALEAIQSRLSVKVQEETS